MVTALPVAVPEAQRHSIRDIPITSSTPAFAAATQSVPVSAGRRNLMDSMLPIQNPDVIYRTLAEGAVLFSTRDEVYFGLNDVGARVWELLPPTLRTVDEVCAELARQYADADRQMIREDVEDLLASLAAHGLVLIRSEESGDETTARTASGTADA